MNSGEADYSSLRRRGYTRRRYRDVRVGIYVETNLRSSEFWCMVKQGQNDGLNHFHLIAAHDSTGT